MACHSLEGVTHPQPFQAKPSEKKRWFCLGKKKRGCSQQKGKGTNPFLAKSKERVFFSCFIQATDECRSHIVVNPQHSEKSGLS